MAEMKNLSNYHYKPVGENVYILTVYFTEIQHKSQMFWKFPKFINPKEKRN